MNKLIDRFECSEYFGEKYQMGLFHPEEAWDIFENRKNRISEDGEFLIIGEMFDSNDCYFCYRASQSGIWRY